MKCDSCGKEAEKTYEVAGMELCGPCTSPPKTGGKTWHLELSIDELIALAKMGCDWQEMKIASGHMSIEELATLDYLNQISERFPDEDWFPDEVKP